MSHHIVRTPSQLPVLLKGFRRAAGLTQLQAAQRLGVTQQTFSALERNAEGVSFGRLMKLLSVLGVELALQQKTPHASEPAAGDRTPW